MMRFRAILSDPGNSNAERPLQILTNSRQDVEEWALGNNQSPGVLAKAVSPDAFVDVYQISVDPPFCIVVDFLRLQKP
jgi:hypothetical protein